jgi:hypothetical protein
MLNLPHFFVKRMEKHKLGTTPVIIENRLSPPQPQVMPFGAFITALFDALASEGVRPFVLRNYEGFPGSNVGSDVDFLIRRRELPRALRALQSIQGIQIVGYAQRHYVAHVFVEGVTAAPGVRSLGVDFIWSMNWKGLPYMPAETVLAAALPLTAGNATFYAPAPVHEAVISLLATLIIGGRLKEKYLPKVRQRFISNRSEAISALSPQFGLRVATRLVEAVIGDDRQESLDCVRPLRLALVLRGLWRRPLRSLFASVGYHVREFIVRRTPKTLETICLLNANECGEAEMAANLASLLKYSAKLVECRHFGPADPLLAESSRATGGDAQSGFFASLASMAKIVIEAAKEWPRLFRKRDNLTLRVSPCSRYTLAIGPKKRREKISWRFTRFVWTLLPPPDLWLLLDTAADKMLSANLGLAREDAERMLESYRSFAMTRKNCIILDACKPDGEVTENAYRAIIMALVRRAQSAMQGRMLP